MNSDIRCACPHCQQHIEAPADMAGTTAECPKCGGSFVVPISISVITPQTTAQKFKSCQFCGEQILSMANKCKHCGEFLNNFENREKSENPVYVNHQSNHVPVSATSERSGSTQNALPSEEDNSRLIKIVVAVIGMAVVLLFSFLQSRAHNLRNTATEQSTLTNINNKMTFGEYFAKYGGSISSDDKEAILFWLIQDKLISELMIHHPRKAEQLISDVQSSSKYDDSKHNAIKRNL